MHPAPTLYGSGLRVCGFGGVGGFRFGVSGFGGLRFAVFEFRGSGLGFRENSMAGCVNCWVRWLQSSLICV